MDEAQEVKDKAESMRQQGEALQRRAQEVLERAEEMEDQADTIHIRAYELEEDTIPDMEEQISSQINHLNINLELDRESKARILNCQAQAAEHHATAQRFRQQSTEKITEADRLRGESGAQAMKGLHMDQMGWHCKAKPFNLSAADFGEQAVQKETEAKEAINQAEQSDQEVIHLLNHAMARGAYLNELREERRYLSANIEQACQEVSQTRDRKRRLKDQESLIRDAYGSLENQASDMEEASANAHDIAEKLYKDHQKAVLKIRDNKNSRYE